MSVSPQSIEGGAPADGVIARAATGAKYALFLLFAINLLNFFDRQLLGSLAEPIRMEFHLNDAALGLLGSIFTVIYALVGLPLGTLSDKWYRNRLIALGTLFWSLLTAATGFAQNYAQIFIARLGVGVGEATCAPAGQSLIGDLFPANPARKGHGRLYAGAAGGHFSGLHQRRRHRHEIRLARGVLVCLRSRSDSRNHGAVDARTGARRARCRQSGDDPRHGNQKRVCRRAGVADDVVDHHVGHFSQLQHVCNQHVQHRIPAALSST